MQGNARNKPLSVHPHGLATFDFTAKGLRLTWPSQWSHGVCLDFLHPGRVPIGTPENVKFSYHTLSGTVHFFSLYHPSRNAGLCRLGPTVERGLSSLHWSVSCPRAFPCMELFLHSLFLSKPGYRHTWPDVTIQSRTIIADIILKITQIQCISVFYLFQWTFVPKTSYLTIMIMNRWLAK